MYPLGRKHTKSCPGHQKCRECHPETKGNRATELVTVRREVRDELAYRPWQMLSEYESLRLLLRMREDTQDLLERKDRRQTGPTSLELRQRLNKLADDSLLPDEIAALNGFNQDLARTLICQRRNCA